MKMIEREHSFFFDGIFPGHITAGFSKPVVTGDPAEDIKKIFSPDPVRVGYMKQLHTDIIHRIDGPGVYNGDGIFTLEKGLCLAVKTADCMPFIVYDSKTDMTGVVHMGWRSAYHGILEKIPCDMTAAIVIAGVGMRRCCYEVGGEFAGYPGLKEHVFKDGEALHFDPVGYARAVLTGMGLSEDRFFDTGICSICSPEKFHSFRRDRTKKRTLSFIIKC